MPKVLIVDDDAGTRDTVSKNLNLRHPEWEVETAQLHTTALEKLNVALNARAAFDVVVTDLWMDNDLGGEKLIIEAPKIDPHLVVILYTSEIEMLDRYKLLEAGAYDVLETSRPGMKFIDEIDLRVQTALIQRQRMRTVSMLSRFFDTNLLNTIHADNTLLPLSQRRVTVVFWDIRGFSVLCDTLKAYPQEIAGFLREYCDAATQAIFDQLGVLDKFIGDGVMAIFRIPQDESDEGTADAIAAIEAAKALRANFQPLLEKWLPRWKKKEPKQIDIGLGCGIHTGDMLVGTLGTGLRDQFTALGPHVNFTARIENKADKGQILLSGSTNELVKQRIATRLVDKGELKGIPGPFDLYEVL